MIWWLVAAAFFLLNFVKDYNAWVNESNGDVVIVHFNSFYHQFFSTISLITFDGHNIFIILFFYIIPDHWLNWPSIGFSFFIWFAIDWLIEWMILFALLLFIFSIIFFFFYSDSLEFNFAILHFFLLSMLINQWWWWWSMMIIIIIIIIEKKILHLYEIQIDSNRITTTTTTTTSIDWSIPMSTNSLCSWSSIIWHYDFFSASFSTTQSIHPHSKYCPPYPSSGLVYLWLSTSTPTNSCTSSSFKERSPLSFRNSDVIYCHP